MGADTEGHGDNAGIFHRECGGKTIFQKLMPDLQAETEGIAAQSLRRLPQLQGGLQHLFKFRVIKITGAGIPVHRVTDISGSHFVQIVFPGQVIDAHLAVLQLAVDLPVFLQGPAEAIPKVGGPGLQGGQGKGICHQVDAALVLQRL